MVPARIEDRNKKLILLTENELSFRTKKQKRKEEKHL
tara:strand:- start:103 stop:213 length:111 start_codon:yes stop_codon:yes gene_type:complete